MATLTKVDITYRCWRAWQWLRLSYWSLGAVSDKHPARHLNIGDVGDDPC